MHRILGSAVPALVLAAALGASLSACGDDTASDAGSEPSSQPSVTAISPGGGGMTDSQGDTVDFDLVGTYTVTAAGGDLSDVAVPLADDTSMQAFLSQFDSDDLAGQLQAAAEAADVPDGQVLYGAVVLIGCDAPTEVSVTRSDAGLVIAAGKVPSPMQECFAPMTTVALVTAPIAG